MNRVIFGVDPGLEGGIAALELDPGTYEILEVSVIAMPTKPGAKGRRDVDGYAVGDFFSTRSHLRVVVGASVESVHAMPKQGVTSCFNFGKSYGKLLGIIESQGIPLDEPTPQQWKKLVLAGMGAAGASLSDKKLSIRYVCNHHPGVALKATPRSVRQHDGMAEAICLAEYGRRTLLRGMGGRPTQPGEQPWSNHDNIKASPHEV